jgi:hypothetical protein
MRLPTDTRTRFAPILIAFCLGGLADSVFGAAFEPVWSERHRRRSADPSWAQPPAPLPVGATPYTGPPVPLPPPTIEYGPISNREGIALKESLPIEHQRYLTYLYARIGRTDMAEHMARRVLADDPAHRDTLLAMTVMHTDRKQADQALAYASTMYRLYPADREAVYYYGMANFLAGNYQESTRILQELRMTQYVNRPFPYNVDLAQSALRAGNWERAISAYRELLDNNPVNDDLRREVRAVLDQLYRRHLNLVEAKANGYLLDSGKFWQFQLTGRHQINRRTQVFLHAEHDQIKVEQTGVLRRRWNDANEIWAGIEHELKPHMYLSGWAGGANEGAQGGARYRHRFGEKGEVSVETFINEKARDSLLLQSLDGRQHRLSLNASYYLTPRLLIFGQLGGRQVRVAGDEIGRAINGSWNAEWFIQRDGPVFRLGYRGLATSFGRRIETTGILAPAIIPGTPAAAQRPLLEQFVLNRIHREGVYADWLGRLYGPVFLHLRSGFDYAFEQGSPEYYGRVGLQVYPRRSLELSTEVGYVSSVATADSASGQWEINIALRYWF